MQETSLNPLAFSAMKYLDVETFEDDMAREIQKKKYLSEREKVRLIKL